MATNEQTTSEADERAFTIDVARDAVLMGRTDDAIRILSQVMDQADAERGVAAMVYDHLRSTTPKSQPLVGDILCCSWGYEQTNIDYYQVVAVTKASVKIREIASQHVGGGTGYDLVAPVRDRFMEGNIPGTNKRWEGRSITKRFTVSDHYGYCCRVTDHSHAYLWDGKADHATAAGYGH